MEGLYCANCLRRAPAYPCPLCGYDPAGTPGVARAMDPCILHGRYLTGRVLEKNALEMVYAGRDLALDRRVDIHEFFPAGKAERCADGSLHWTAPPRPEEALPPQPHRPGETLLDSFSEHNTIYTICQPIPPCPPAPAAGKKERRMAPLPAGPARPGPGRPHRRPLAHSHMVAAQRPGEKAKNVSAIRQIGVYLSATVGMGLAPSVCVSRGSRRFVT